MKFDVRYPNVFIHESAIVDDGAVVGEETKIWHFTHVQRGAFIGAQVMLGQNVFVGSGAIVGDRCRIQNNVSIYQGVELAEGVFCGPSCVFTNDLTPRACFPKEPVNRIKTIVGKHATLGANTTIVCGIELGEYCMIGAGSVVTKSVPAHALMVGVPARRAGWVCVCGTKLDSALICPACAQRFTKLPGTAGLKTSC